MSSSNIHVNKIDDTHKHQHFLHPLAPRYWPRQARWQAARSAVPYAPARYVLLCIRCCNARMVLLMLYCGCRWLIRGFKVELRARLPVRLCCALLHGATTMSWQGSRDRVAFRGGVVLEDSSTYQLTLSHRNLDHNVVRASPDDTSVAHPTIIRLREQCLRQHTILSSPSTNQREASRIREPQATTRPQWWTGRADAAAGGEARDTQ